MSKAFDGSRLELTAASANWSPRVVGGRDSEKKSLAEGFAAIELLCAALEDIADRLPRQFCPLACARSAVALTTQVPDFQQQLLCDITDGLATSRSNLVWLEQMFDDDAGLATDIASTLQALADGGAPDNPEQLGYMLRCYFQGYRKSMAIAYLLLTCRAPDLARLSKLVGQR
jgi:hypothetical protein